jgi:phosphoenolpyruvate synthase/pyruvate phosphate dikinase
MVRHLTHDPVENPTARPHGTPQSKISDAGHAIVQVLTLADLMGVDIQEAVNAALLNLRTRDFQKREAKNPDEVSGDVAAISPFESSRMATGRAWVIEEGEKLIFPSDGDECPILVISHSTSDARIAKFKGIVTDHGGLNCHAAIIAREASMNCIVGTGNATKKIRTGDLIKMNMNSGQVILLKN